MKTRTRDASAAGSRAGTVAARLAAKAQAEAAAAENDTAEQPKDGETATESTTTEGTNATAAETPATDDAATDDGAATEDEGAEEEMTPEALAAAQPKAFAAGVARERARITGILALAAKVSGPRATRLVSAALEDGDATEASLAIALVREGAITASAAVAARAGDEAALDAPSGAAGQDMGDVGSTITSMVALLNKHNPKRRPDTAGRN